MVICVCSSASAEGLDLCEIRMSLSYQEGEKSPV